MQKTQQPQNTKRSKSRTFQPATTAHQPTNKHLAKTLTRIFPFFCLASLALLVLALLRPAVISTTGATTGNSNVGVTLQGEAIAIISPPSTITTNITPGSGTTIDTATANITVATNNKTGYTLSVSAKDGITNLVNTTDNTKIIKTLSDAQGAALTDVPAADFPVNQWGISANSGTTYSGLDASSATTLKTTSTRSGSDTTTITLGTKVNRDTAAGTYSNTLTFTAVTNAPSSTCNPSATTIGDAVCMQDINTSVKNSMLAGVTYELFDSRDKNFYAIAKLNDGNVWMLDNLRLGGTTTTALTPADTNIASSYTLPASGTPCFTRSSCTGTSGTSGTGYTVAAINTDYKNATTTSWGSGSGKIGTYYNFCAASAGTYCYDSGSGTENAQYDVCPKGWRMPTGDREYKNLYTTYNNDQTSFKFALSVPLSGDMYDGSVELQGSDGYFWSSTVNPRSKARGMWALEVFSSSVHFDRSSYTRENGFSIRCVAQ